MLLAVFALPLFVAWLFTMGPLDWRPTKTINHGVLLEPPLRLDSYGVMDATGAALTVNAIARNWFLVVLRTTACTEPCQGMLKIAERIQIAVGRDSHRVAIALLSRDDDSPTFVGEKWLLSADTRLVDALRHATDEPQLHTALLIVDHQGIVVLVYPTTEEGPGALYDLKRLLRASAR
jgi:cytochrome oxidase Cu insertion factor (SCO1/SenC/PrrC family)